MADDMNAQFLRSKIIQLAIEGKLVPQIESEGTADELLKEIHAEKDKLLVDGKIKKRFLDVNPVLDDEIPFDIPCTWKWVRLGEFAIDMADGPFGSNLKAEHYTNNQEARIIQLSNIGDDGWREQNSKYTTFEHATRNISRSIVSPGDIVIAKMMPAGRAIICPDHEKMFVLSSDSIKLITVQCVDKDYLIKVINSSFVRGLIAENVQGGTRQRTNIEKIKNAFIPLPPLAEQKRIAEKIEELLTHLDNIEKTKKHYQYLSDQLKKKVLQEAIQGRLVPQIESEGTADELLKEIRAEKERLLAEGKLKKKDLVEKPISEDEIPFEIPANWMWVRLGSIGLFERGSGIKKDETSDIGLPCVRYGEMYTKYRVSTFDKTFSFTTKDVFDACKKAKEGDILMPLTGETREEISLASQYIGKEDVAIGGDLCHLTLLECLPLYFVHVINSPYAVDYKAMVATGDMIIHMSTDKLASMIIPLPPLAEQKRIVEKLEELFSILK